MNKNYLKIAGIINLITALVHLVAGQLDLVRPLINSSLELQQKGELVGVWHMITILLFFTSYLILQAGFTKVNLKEVYHLNILAWLYIFLGIPFIVSSIWFSIFAPQWIVLITIGVLLLLSLHKK